jgi:hypothetical protein
VLKTINSGHHQNSNDYDCTRRVAPFGRSYPGEGCVNNPEASPCAGRSGEPALLSAEDDDELESDDERAAVEASLADGAPDIPFEQVRRVRL